MDEGTKQLLEEARDLIKEQRDFLDRWLKMVNAMNGVVKNLSHRADIEEKMIGELANGRSDLVGKRFRLVELENELVKHIHNLD